MSKGSIKERELILIQCSGGIRVHLGSKKCGGRQAWKPEQEAEKSHHQWQARGSESELGVRHGFEVLKTSPNGILPPARLHLRITSLNGATNWRPSIEIPHTIGGHVSFKPPCQRTSVFYTL